MRKLSDKTRPSSGSEASGQDGDIANAYATCGKSNKSLIYKANSVSIIKLFQFYKLNINEYNRKINCPIPTHKGGREQTASFWYYPETNSFWCFGCNTGTKCCDFVAAMDKTTKSKAADKILELFDSNFIGLPSDNSEDFNSKFEVIIDFSNVIREFIQTYSDEASISFIENICFVYDSIMLKHNLDKTGIIAIIEALKKEITNYRA